MALLCLAQREVAVISELFAELYDASVPSKLKCVNELRDICEFVEVFLSETISVAETDALFAQKCGE